MNRASAIVLGAVLVLLGALPVLFFSADDDDSYREYDPEGYVNTVGEMIDAGALTYDCESEEIGWHPRNEDDEVFFANSYLREDVASWNRGDRRAFQVLTERLRGGGCRGELVRADIGHHRHRLPTYSERGWKGRLFMHQEAASTVLTSSERTIEVIRPPLSVLPMDAEELEDLWIRPGDPRDARSPKLALKMYEESRPFASLETLGDLTALEIFQERPDTVLNGCPVHRGTRLRLESGDSLRLSGDSRTGRYEERFDVDTGDRAGLLSFVTEVNGLPTRQTVDRSLSMAGDVVQAVESAVKIADQEAYFDVHLTLDAFYNDLLTRRLEEFSRRYGNRPLRAAITLLDPASRRVLAAASYPTPTAVERLRIPPDIDEASLERNHNFSVHAIGSATKPFLAAAALAVRPELASLELNCFPGGEAPPELLGYPLDDYNLLGDCGGDDPATAYSVDFEHFLRHSSNRYMLYLGLLSMAEWRGGEPVAASPRVELSNLDRFRLGGRIHTLRPRLPIVKAETKDRTELADVAEQDFPRAVRALFGVSFDYESGLEAAKLEREYWQPVLDQIPGIGEYADQLWAFHLVTPAEVNLAADLIQSFRQDLYTLLLGVGNNQWSNLQLAQAMGRLLTGDGNLRAYLVERIARPVAKNEEGEEEIEVLWDLDEELEEAAGSGDWPLAEQHRQLILRGMASVVEQPGGTARDLRDVLGELNDALLTGVSYRLFAKTGTPSASRGELRDRGTIAAESAREDYPAGPQYKSAVLVLGVQRSAPGEPDEHLVLTFYIEGQGGSEEAVALAGEVLPRLVQGHWPQDWLAAE